MSTPASGKVQNLNESRTEALRALLDSLSPAGPSNAHQGSKITSEQAQRLSQKLDELLGDVADQAGPTQQRNERGELLNEEGLPIIDINEPMAGPDAPPFDPGPTVEEPDVVPLRTLSPQEKEQQRAQMESMLDLLEAEERTELARNEELEHRRMKEEYEQRKANTRKELERLKAAKEMQKKMGKALLRNLSDAKEREEKEKDEQLKRDLEAEAERKQKKPKKKVSFAELPHEGEEDKAPAAGPSKKRLVTPNRGDAPGRLLAQEQKPTMKIDVVERFPSSRKPKIMSPPPPGDESDDNPQPSSPIPADSDEGDAIVSDHDSEHIPTSDSDDDEPHSLDEPVIDEEFDFDTAQHHREIALEYFKKRDSIGVDAARAMSAHLHEPMDEWDQPEVPLEATLSNPHPKPPQSKFKSTISQAYNTSLPSTTPSTSLGGSVLPGASSTLKSAIRLGKLEDDKLVGGGEGESAGEEDDDDVKEFMAALRRGEVTNAGAEQNADTLVAALMKAYSAPEKTEETGEDAVGAPKAALQTQAEAPAPVVAPSKASKFKLNRLPDTTSRSPSDVSDSDPTPISNASRSSPKLPTSNTVLERKPGQPPRQAQSASFTPNRPQNRSPLSTVAAKPGGVVPAVVESPSFRPPPTGASSAASQASTPSTHSSSSRSPARPPNVVASPSFPSMIVDSPSFLPPSSAKPGQMPSMVVDSPSFQRPTSSRPSRPPVVMSTAVRESSGPRAGAQASAPEPAKRASRFKAERS